MSPLGPAAAAGVLAAASAWAAVSPAPARVALGRVWRGRAGRGSGPGLALPGSAHLPDASGGVRPSARSWPDAVRSRAGSAVRAGVGASCAGAWAGVGASCAGAWASGRPLLGLAAPPLAFVLVRERRSSAAARSAAAEAGRVREFTAALAAELRAGRPARPAVVAAAADLAGPLHRPPTGSPPTPSPGPDDSPRGRPYRSPHGAPDRSPYGSPYGTPYRSPYGGPDASTASHRFAGPSAGVCAAWPEALASTAREGGDVAAALEAAAAAPGAEGLRDVAACWRLAEGVGAGLASGLEVVAAGLREREAHRREVSAQLAGVRASGYLLAGLPAFGLALGGALGADPAAVLLDTTVGNAALAAGLALDAVGVAWLGRLARSAGRA